MLQIFLRATRTAVRIVNLPLQAEKQRIVPKRPKVCHDGDQGEEGRGEGRDALWIRAAEAKDTEVVRQMRTNGETEQKSVTRVSLELTISVQSTVRFAAAEAWCNRCWLSAIVVS